MVIATRRQHICLGAQPYCAWWRVVNCAIGLTVLKCVRFTFHQTHAGARARALCTREWLAVLVLRGALPPKLTAFLPLCDASPAGSHVLPHFTINKLAPFAGRMLASGGPGRGNDPIVGLIWVTVSMALLAALGMFGKLASQAGMHPFQVVFFRNFFCVILMLPLLAWRGRSLLRTNQLHLYGLRVTLSMIGMNSWFLALAMIPFTELTAISFLSPLFGTLCAVNFLGEVVRGRRWTALIVGFIGAMVILRPGSGAFHAGHLLAFLSAGIIGIVGPLVKQLTATDDADRIVFLSNLIMTPVSLIPALFVWTNPPMELWPVLIGMGACAVLGHISLVRGFASTDASLVFTFEFSRLPFAALIGWFMFSEPTDYMTWLGALIIFGSALYITNREAQLRKRAAKAVASKIAEPPSKPPTGRNDT